MAAKAGVVASEKTRLRFVPIGAVKMREGFWKARMDRNNEQGIPRLLRHLEDHGVVDNFGIVSGRKKVERKGPYFSDSDLYKWMEGAAWSLLSYDNPKTRADLERVIDEVVAAQGKDGYLNTFFQGELYGQRFRNLPVEHELYCAGHLFQAAVAHYRATGSDKLLGAACRYADYLASVFGEGKRQGVDGHPEVEMALIELYRSTGEKSYLELAGYFLSQLGFKDMQALGGHAVRALYTCCGGADYYAETGDEAYGAAGKRLWGDLASGKIYITGGVGSRFAGEAIGERYELPNSRAYAETCAAIANAMWNYRMLGLYGSASYTDEMERALYNGVISGVSLDGTSYFYVNPLACFEPYQRQEWFGCTCCPTNMVRLLASIPGYMYSTSDDGVWVHLYDNSKVDYQLADGSPFTLEQSTKYPWGENVDIKVGLREPREFTLHLRVPGWCVSLAVAVNGEELPWTYEPDGYLRIRRTWKPGDAVHMSLGMPVMLEECDARVRENYGSVAVRRGPMIYCAESTDNPEASIIDLELVSDGFEAAFEAGLLGGVVTLKGKGLTLMDPSADRGPLYSPRLSVRPRLRQVPITLIPYYAWANRGHSRMAVWMPFRDLKFECADINFSKVRAL